MAGVAPVEPVFQFSDSAGAPLVSGKLYVYLAGTTTQTNSWQDKAQTTLNTNPIILNAAGRCTIWLDDSLSYKFELQNSAGVVQPGYPVDNVPGSSTASSLVTFLAAGSGSVSRTAQAKMRDLMSPQDKGAVADGVANDTAAVTALATSGALNVAPGGTYKATGSTVNVKQILAGVNATFTNDQLFGFSVLDAADIAGGKWACTGGVVFDFAASATRVSLQRATVDDTSASNATAINLARNSISGVRVIGNDVAADGFAFLTNSGGDNISKIVVAGNVLTSNKADAIELNAPGKSHSSIAVTGNVLTGGPTGSGSASGFGVGIARARGVAVTGNSIVSSRNEAIHLEDEQYGNAVVGNVGLEVGGAGVWFGQYATGNGEGMPIVGNSMRAAAGNTQPGIYAIYDGNGSIPGVTVVGNRVRGFQDGLTTGAQQIIADGNVIESATNAIHSEGGGHVHGTNLARNCTTLVKTGQSVFVGKVASTTTPTTILDSSTHGATDLRTCLRGFLFPTGTIAIAGASAVTTATLFALGTRMFGRLRLMVKRVGGVSNIYTSATIKWDGATLTVADFLKESVGALDASGGAASLTAGSGNLRIDIFNSGADCDVIIGVDFEGEYYK